MIKAKNKQHKRYVIKLYGIVQGVGFRPFVYKKAGNYKLKGKVSNIGSTLVIDVEGEKEGIKEFLIEILTEPPPLAKIEKIRIKAKQFIGYRGFKIIKSSTQQGDIKFVSPDIAVCRKCMSEVKDEKSNRYRYAFTNCTQCGPRYSIVKALPYDRKNTTMAPFKMCDTCQEEYENPDSRRFHAQPNCCRVCGPQLSLLDRNKLPIRCNDPVDKSVSLIKQGYIIAVKGIGGYHLCCDAMNSKAIEILRERKNRPDKPFAVMAKDLQVVKKICCVSGVEETVLANNRRPILLLTKKLLSRIPSSIAPGLKKIGIMLPYTPLHHMLFAKDIELLVMTSGNISGMAIQFKDEKAFNNLGSLADYFLTHDREINVPVDDSVVKIVKDKEMVSRCGRGYTPLFFKMKLKKDILAVGAEQKATFALLHNGYAVLSQYIGDLKDLDSYNNFKWCIKNMNNIFRVKPDIFVHDLHPDYLSTRYAKLKKGYKISVQHHHAHMVSCMVEHGLYDKAIGVIYDGTGMGIDGNIWGGEFFIASRSIFERVGHLQNVVLQGGNKVIKEPWRSALGYMHSLNIDAKEYLDLKGPEINLIEKALEQNINCFKTSSMGRLFDCVSALLKVRLHITYDAQAAIELESLVDETVKDYYQYKIKNSNKFIILYKNIISGIINDIKKGLSPNIISTKFHNTITRFTIDCVLKISKKYKLENVILSGGVFENEYLLSNILEGLTNMGFKVYYNRFIPINDSGISIGQIGVAEAYIREEMINVPGGSR